MWFSVTIAPTDFRSRSQKPEPEDVPRLPAHAAGVSALGALRVTRTVLQSRAWTPSHQPMYTRPPGDPQGPVLTYTVYI